MDQATLADNTNPLPNQTGIEPNNSQLSELLGALVGILIVAAVFYGFYKNVIADSPAEAALHRGQTLYAAAKELGFLTQCPNDKAGEQDRCFVRNHIVLPSNGWAKTDTDIPILACYQEGLWSCTVEFNELSDTLPEKYSAWLSRYEPSVLASYAAKMTAETQQRRAQLERAFERRPTGTRN